MAENHTGTLSHLRSPELAVRAFEAEIQFNEALSSFQGDNLPLLAGTDAASFLQAANRAGFSWTIRAVHGDSVELALLHDGGAESAITTTAAALLPTLLGLLGVFPAVHQAAPQPVEPENAPTNPEPQQPKPAKPSREALPEYGKSRARFEYEKANLLELQRKTQEGQLLRREDAEQAWGSAVNITRSRLLGVPSAAKQRIPHLELEEVELLTLLIREALEELAAGDLTA